MQIVFDPNKDAANKEKHGISLADGSDFEWDEAVLWPDVRRDYGEARMAGIVCAKPINVRRVSMPKLKSTHISVTDIEDIAITAAAMSDTDSIPYTDTQWAQAKPLMRIGRPKAETTKERITIRLSRDVVSKFRATGHGWQTRLDGVLRRYMMENAVAS